MHSMNWEWHDMDAANLWERYQRYLCQVPAFGLALDVTRVEFEDGFLERMAPSLVKAFEAMEALEKGAQANPDEKRMVGHYWLRTPDRAPTPAIAAEIRQTIDEVKAFAAKIHGGLLQPPGGSRFSRVLSIGIGG